MTRPTKGGVEVARPAAPEPGADTMARIRSAYATGNQRLFAGDSAGAIAAYEQTIALAPSHAAGYRGLGLAYAQAGDKRRALAALKTYVKLAPRAKDVPLIRKRIVALGK